MDYNILWFVLIVVLFTGFFFLEGFDYGVGTLLTLISDKGATALSSSAASALSGTATRSG